MKRFILVAGVDYTFKGKGVDFRIYCNNRVKRMVAAKKKEDLVFQIFDFKRGEVVTHKITYSDGKKTEKISKLTPFKAITKSNYSDVSCSGGTSHYRFKDGQKGVMSILDVYKAVQKIGTDAPNTLVELSFFSHAFHGGPILVNSCDDSVIRLERPVPKEISLPPGARDPDDMDPRVKDFHSPTMDAAELTSFQDAFDRDGYIWSWGCLSSKLLNQILTKIERNPVYKPSGLGDDVVFKITGLTTEAAELLLRLGDVFDVPSSDKKKIEIEFKYLKYLFCKAIAGSYNNNIAHYAKVKAFGAVPGTYSGYDTGILPLMSVHKGFTSHFAFYKNYFGFDYDPEGRHYGEYKPDFTCAAPSP